VARTCNPTGGVCETTADTYNVRTNAYYRCVCDTTVYGVDEMDAWCNVYTGRTPAPAARASHNCDPWTFTILLTVCALITRMHVCV